MTTVKAIINKRVNATKSKPAPKKKVEDKYPYYTLDEEEFKNAKDYLEETGGFYIKDIDDLEFVKFISNRKVVKLQFSTDPATHTCGFIEVGDLSCSKVTKEDAVHLADLLDNLVILSDGYTLFMNTNGESYSLYLERALPLTKNWNKVKVYKNPGSGNTLTLWVTNN